MKSFSSHFIVYSRERKIANIFFFFLLSLDYVVRLFPFDSEHNYPYHLIMLRSEYDPMGHAIADFHSTGKADRLLVESDLCETDEIPVPYLFRDFDEMPAIEQRAMDLCRGHVLDVGAAAGSHSLWMQKNNIPSTAIDISELSVETMKKRGIKNAQCADFYNLHEAYKYDTMLFLMNGAGLAGNTEGLAFFLQKCKSLLKPNGQVLLDSSNIIYMYDSPGELPEYYYGEVQYQMIYKEIFSKWFNWLFVDFKLLHTKAAAEGLQCIKVMNGSNFDYLAQLTF